VIESLGAILWGSYWFQPAALHLIRFDGIRDAAQYSRAFVIFTRTNHVGEQRHWRPPVAPFNFWT
jgi:hypothetical protein